MKLDKLLSDAPDILTNSTLTEEEEQYIHIITKYLVPIMFSIVFVIGSVGNILVIYVVGIQV